MRRISTICLVLSWGLWFGGLIVLFLAVSALFKAFPDRHDIAGKGAAQIFRIFNIYQGILAAIVLVAALFSRPAGGSRASNALLLMLAVATATAFFVALWLTPQIERLRLEGFTHTPEFSRLHGLSMGLSFVESLFLLAAGLVLPAVVEQRR